MVYCKYDMYLSLYKPIYNRFTFCWIYLNADAAELYDIYLHTSHGCDPVRIFWRINNAVRADNSYFKEVFRIKHKIMDWNHGTAYLKLYNKCMMSAPNFILYVEIPYKHKSCSVNNLKVTNI